MGVRPVNPGEASAARYSEAVEVDLGSARMLFVSGHIARDADGDVVGVGDTEAQVREIFRQIDELLRSAGGALEDVIRTTVYLTDMREIDQVRAVRDAVDWKVAPATTAVEVSHLIDPGLRVVIDAVAVIPAS